MNAIKIIKTFKAGRTLGVVYSVNNHRKCSTFIPAEHARCIEDVLDFLRVSVGGAERVSRTAFSLLIMQIDQLGHDSEAEFARAAVLITRRGMGWILTPSQRLQIARSIATRKRCLAREVAFRGRRMNARFPGRCALTQQRFDAGASIYYSEGRAFLESSIAA